MLVESLVTARVGRIVAFPRLPGESLARAHARLSCRVRTDPPKSLRFFTFSLRSDSAHKLVLVTKTGVRTEELKIHREIARVLKRSDKLMEREKERKDSEQWRKLRLVLEWAKRSHVKETDLRKLKIRFAAVARVIRRRGALLS